MKPIYILLIITLISCGKKDKHPNIPVFTENLLEGLAYEKIDYSTYYLGKTNKLSFFSHHVRDEKFIKIVNKQKGNLVKSIPFKSYNSFIDEKGTVYLQSEDSVFKYEAPLFKKKKIAFITFEYPTTKYYKDKYPKRFKEFNYKEEVNFVEAKIDSFVKEKYLKNISYAFKLGGLKYFFKAKDVEFVAFCDFLDERKIFAKRKKIYNFREFKELTHLSNESLVKTKHLDKFDEVTLNYKFDSQNHFAFTIKTEKMRYYNFKLHNKEIQFKTSFATEYRDYKGNLLLSVDHEVYKLKE